MRESGSKKCKPVVANLLGSRRLFSILETDKPVTKAQQSFINFLFFIRPTSLKPNELVPCPWWIQQPENTYQVMFYNPPELEDLRRFNPTFVGMFDPKDVNSRMKQHMIRSLRWVTQTNTFGFRSKMFRDGRTFLERADKETIRSAKQRLMQKPEATRNNSTLDRFLIFSNNPDEIKYSTPIFKHVSLDKNEIQVTLSDAYYEQLQHSLTFMCLRVDSKFDECILRFEDTMPDVVLFSYKFHEYHLSDPDYKVEYVRAARLVKGKKGSDPLTAPEIRHLGQGAPGKSIDHIALPYFQLAYPDYVWRCNDVHCMGVKTSTFDDWKTHGHEFDFFSTDSTQQYFWSIDQRKVSPHISLDTILGKLSGTETKDYLFDIHANYLPIDILLTKNVPEAKSDIINKIWQIIFEGDFEQTRRKIVPSAWCTDCGVNEMDWVAFKQRNKTLYEHMESWGWIYIRADRLFITAEAHITAQQKLQCLLTLSSLQSLGNMDVNGPTRWYLCSRDWNRDDHRNVGFQVTFQGSPYIVSTKDDENVICMRKHATSKIYERKDHPDQFQNAAIESIADYGTYLSFKCYYNILKSAAPVLSPTHPLLAGYNGLNGNRSKWEMGTDNFRKRLIEHNTPPADLFSALRQKGQHDRLLVVSFLYLHAYVSLNCLQAMRAFTRKALASPDQPSIWGTETFKYIHELINTHENILRFQKETLETSKTYTSHPHWPPFLQKLQQLSRELKLPFFTETTDYYTWIPYRWRLTDSYVESVGDARITFQRFDTRSR